MKVIKSWNRKMFSLHYQTFERDENLRSTNFKEFQAADYKLWAGENGILEMINFRKMEWVKLFTIVLLYAQRWHNCCNRAR